MLKRTTLYLIFVFVMNFLGFWPRLWLRGPAAGLWRIFRLRDLLRAIARRRERIPRNHGWLQTDDTIPTASL
jgi:hypothetical protein